MGSEMEFDRYAYVVSSAPQGKEKYEVLYTPQRSKVLRKVHARHPKVTTNSNLGLIGQSSLLTALSQFVLPTFPSLPSWLLPKTFREDLAVSSLHAAILLSSLTSRQRRGAALVHATLVGTCRQIRVPSTSLNPKHVAFSAFPPNTICIHSRSEGSLASICTLPAKYISHPDRP